ncbi:cold shock domain-containing protein 3-like [Gossypium australe]|uniref:Cold shock domain-containing protein 3-like n=1 Tax=Gossypium australe TaxID=47621 RepID=A0A5B6VKY4_9ROSI|nr:cold shock domain-containing protein 3-like [Gossypium australe]
MTTKVEWLPICRYCDRHHSDECWRKIGVCFKCVSTQHQINECPHLVKLVIRFSLRGQFSSLLGAVVSSGVVMEVVVDRGQRAQERYRLRRDSQLCICGEAPQGQRYS